MSVLEATQIGVRKGQGATAVCVMNMNTFLFSLFFFEQCILRSLAIRELPCRIVFVRMTMGHIATRVCKMEILSF